MSKGWRGWVLPALFCLLMTGLFVAPIILLGETLCRARMNYLREYGHTRGQWAECRPNPWFDRFFEDKP